MGERKLDFDEVTKIVPQAYGYRHTLAHGSGGDFTVLGTRKQGGCLLISSTCII